VIVRHGCLPLKHPPQLLTQVHATGALRTHPEGLTPPLHARNI
jgi:hypothetical protein